LATPININKVSSISINCKRRVSLNRVRVKTEDRESPSQRYAPRLKRGCPFKPICFFASLDDLGRVGDSSLIEEGR
jgi:hypothetical protein